MSASYVRHVGAPAPLSRRHAHVEASSRLGWISLTLGLISLDLDALALLGGIVPLARWYSDWLLAVGPAPGVVMAMLVMGGPVALLGLICAAAIVLRSRASLSAFFGVIFSVLALAIPLCYALFIFTYLGGLL